MKYLLVSGLALVLVACAGATHREPPASRLDNAALAELEAPVDRVYLPSVSNWRPVDRKHVIVYRSPNRAYLLELDHEVVDPFYDHEWTIGLRRSNGYLSAGFDYVLIDGWRHYISSIRPLTREQADRLTG